MSSGCAPCQAMKPKAPRELSCAPGCERVMDDPYTYPEGPAGAELNLEQNPEELGCLFHNKPVHIVHTCFYKHEGAHILRLGEGFQMQYTTHPEDLTSDLLTFRFKKYRTFPNAERDAQGNLTYQSQGLCIREGDNLMADNVAHPNRMLTHAGYVTKYNTPYFNVPIQTADEDFLEYGTKSPENWRIISADYDPTVPRNQQPIIRMDGTKKYYIQSTRTSQFLALLPYQSPAPCLIKTHGRMGPETAFVFLDTDFARKSRAESLSRQQQAPVQPQQPVPPVPTTVAAPESTMPADGQTAQQEQGDQTAPQAPATQPAPQTNGQQQPQGAATPMQEAA